MRPFCRVRWAIVLGSALVAAAVAATIVVGTQLASTPARASVGQPASAAAEKEATGVAAQFFRALDTRHFARACDLLSAASIS